MQGVLKGFDQTINVILEDCHERVYSEVHCQYFVLLFMCIINWTLIQLSMFMFYFSACCLQEAGVEQEMLGLYLIRGDNM